MGKLTRDSEEWRMGGAMDNGQWTIDNGGRGMTTAEGAEHAEGKNKGKG